MTLSSLEFGCLSLKIKGSVGRMWGQTLEVARMELNKASHRGSFSHPLSRDQVQMARKNDCGRCAQWRRSALATQARRKGYHSCHRAASPTAFGCVPPHPSVAGSSAERPSPLPPPWRCAASGTDLAVDAGRQRNRIARLYPSTMGVNHGPSVIVNLGCPVSTPPPKMPNSSGVWSRGRSLRQRQISRNRLIHFGVNTTAEIRHRNLW